MNKEPVTLMKEGGSMNRVTGLQLGQILEQG